MSVWMWNIRRRNRSCDGLLLLVPLSLLTCEILRGPGGQQRLETYHIKKKRKKKEKNADPLFNRLYLKQMNYKTRAYIFQRTHVEASVELVNHWITRENINRISRQTCTHALRRACQKGGLPYGTGHPKRAKKNSPSARRPFLCYPMILAFYDGEKAPKNTKQLK